MKSILKKLFTKFTKTEKVISPFENKTLSELIEYRNKLKFDHIRSKGEQRKNTYIELVKVDQEITKRESQSS